MGYTDKALSAHIKSTLHSGFTLINEKIADLAPGDTLKHFVTLADLGLPDTAVCLILGVVKTSGIGFFYVYPNEATRSTRLEEAGGTPPSHPFGVANKRIQYSIQTATDVYELYCFGYWHSGRIEG